MEAILEMTIGDNIKYYREISNLTQVQLAEHLGVSKGLISQYENSASTPPVEKIISMAKIFGVTVDALVNPQTPGESINTKQTGGRNKAQINYKGQINIPANDQDDARQKLELAEAEIRRLAGENELLKEINALLKEGRKE
jgi:transcriptional regulator with XRE-family HTH domain